jgi:hypothetical protein
MPALNLSDATVAAINRARDDQAAAAAADQDVTNYQGGLKSAQEAYAAAQDKAFAAHKNALQSAHAAVDALVSELGLAVTPAAQARRP